MLLPQRLLLLLLMQAPALLLLSSQLLVLFLQAQLGCRVETPMDHCCAAQCHLLQGGLQQAAAPAGCHMCLFLHGDLEHILLP
jgi:hypothetical protein